MLRELIHLQVEALRLMTVYNEYKDSDNEYMRRKVHLDLDRFLMEHRDIAILLMVERLDLIIKEERQEPKKASWLRRLVAK